MKKCISIPCFIVAGSIENTIEHLYTRRTWILAMMTLVYLHEFFMSYLFVHSDAMQLQLEIIYFVHKYLFDIRLSFSCNMYIPSFSQCVVSSNVLFSIAV